MKEVTITGKDFDEVFVKAGNYFSDNGYTYNAESLRKLIMRANDKAAATNKRLTIGDTIRGAKAFIKYLAGKAASNKEIQRRSNICIGCLEVSSVSDCLGCGGSGKIANSVNSVRAAKGQETLIPDSIKDKYCGICDCSLTMLITAQHKDLKPESEPKNLLRPNHCWLKVGSSNFTKE